MAKGLKPKRQRAERKSKVSTGFELPADTERPRYEVLVDELRKQIASGRLAPGDAVPSVRQLVRDLGVSYTTVTRGLRTLVEQGVLEARVGSGTRVAMRREKRAIGLLGLVKYADMMKSAYMVRALEQFQRLIIQSHRTVLYRHVSPDVKLHDEFDRFQLVDGVVLLGNVLDLGSGRSKAEVEQLTASGTPMVGLGASAVPGLACFDSDNEGDSYRMTEWLIRQGHQRIAFLYMDLVSYKGATSRRLVGVRMALKENKVKLGEEYFLAGSVEEQIQGLLKLKDPPTAVFVVSGIHRFTDIYNALKGTPIELGEKVLVAAYDENFWRQIVPFGIRHIRVDQPLDAIVDRAFDSLEMMIVKPGYVPESIEERARFVEVTREGDMRALKMG